MRKIIQIAARPAGEGHWPRVYALCDDGTLWERDDDRHDTWEQFPPIPQSPAMCPECLGRREVMHCDRGFMERAACTRCGGAGVVEVTP